MRPSLPLESLLEMHDGTFRISIEDCVLEMTLDERGQLISSQVYSRHGAMVQRSEHAWEVVVDLGDREVPLGDHTIATLLEQSHRNAPVTIIAKAIRTALQVSSLRALLRTRELEGGRLFVNLALHWVDACCTDHRRGRIAYPSFPIVDGSGIGKTRLLQEMGQMANTLVVHVLCRRSQDANPSTLAERLLYLSGEYVHEYNGLVLQIRAVYRQILAFLVMQRGWNGTDDLRSFSPGLPSLADLSRLFFMACNQTEEAAQSNIWAQVLKTGVEEKHYTNHLLQALGNPRFVIAFDEASGLLVGSRESTSRGYLFRAMRSAAAIVAFEGYCHENELGEHHAILARQIDMLNKGSLARMADEELKEALYRLRGYEFSTGRDGERTALWRHGQRGLEEKRFCLIFTDTHSRVANFAPSAEADPSNRPTKGFHRERNELFPPLSLIPNYDLGLGDYLGLMSADGPLPRGVLERHTVGTMLRIGRPLWMSYYMTFKNFELVLSNAAAKILCNSPESLAPTIAPTKEELGKIKSRLIAPFAIRIPFKFSFFTQLSARLGSESMMPAGVIAEDREHTYSRYRAEPVLGSAASKLLVESEYRRDMLMTVVEHFRVAAPDAGYGGEFVAMMLMTAAVDHASGNKPYNPVRARDFLSFAAGREDPLDTGRRAMDNCYVCFTQFVRCHSSLSWKRIVDGLLHYVAFACRPNQEGFDLVIPLQCGGELRHLEATMDDDGGRERRETRQQQQQESLEMTRGRVGAILVQVKNHAGTTMSKGWFKSMRKPVYGMVQDLVGRGETNVKDAPLWVCCISLRQDAALASIAVAHWSELFHPDEVELFSDSDPEKRGFWDRKDPDPPAPTMRRKRPDAEARTFGMRSVPHEPTIQDFRTMHMNSWGHPDLLRAILDAVSNKSNQVMNAFSTSLQRTAFSKDGRQMAEQAYVEFDIFDLSPEG